MRAQSCGSVMEVSAMAARKWTVLAFVLISAGCERSPSPPTKSPPLEADAPVAPQGFDQRLLEVLRCPENLTVLRLATRGELRKMNEHILAGKLKRWGGQAIADPVDAVLIRADGKVGYRFQGPAPVMIID